jgi:hypothetical protein
MFFCNVAHVLPQRPSEPCPRFACALWRAVINSAEVVKILAHSFFGVEVWPIYLLAYGAAPVSIEA